MHMTSFALITRFGCICIVGSMRLFVSRTAVSKVALQPFIHKPIKLPVWPVWSGVIAQVAEWIGLPQISENILSEIGGRVVPVTLSDLKVSPFLLLAHHSHSFTPLDPIRAMTTFFLPEGFPAHPHSGFDTVTYCIDGGLRHRDSEGIKMAYGDGDVQWMRAGRGVIHEEMWDLKDSDWKHKRIEIFQLWVNLPKASKGLPPSVHHLHGKDIPDVDFGDGVSMRVICGSTSTSNHESIPTTGNTPLNTDDIDSEGPGSKVAQSPVGIYHINMRNGGSCVHLGIDSDCSMTTYIRRGSLLVQTDNDSPNKNDANSVGVKRTEELKHGELVIFRGPTSGAGNSDSDSLYENDGTIRSRTTTATATLQAGPNGLDALILVGRPLNEPVLWSGPLVQADEESFSRSARVFNNIGRDGYWDYKMSDEDWEEHCKKLRLQDFISASRGEPL